MTKTCSTTAIIQRAHHIIAMSIKKSLENSRTMLVESRSLNSLVLSLRCIVMSKIMKKVEGLLRVLKKNVIKNSIKHEDYKNTLINNEQMPHQMKTIRSQRHQLGSYEINKYCSADLMISTASMIMEQAVMPMDTTKYNHKHQSFYQTYQPPYFWTRYRFSLLFQNISLHTSGQEIDSLYFRKISASNTFGQDMVRGTRHR